MALMLMITKLAELVVNPDTPHHLDTIDPLIEIRPALNLTSVQTTMHSSLNSSPRPAGANQHRHDRQLAHEKLEPSLA